MTNDEIIAWRATITDPEGIYAKSGRQEEYLAEFDAQVAAARQAGQLPPVVTPEQRIRQIKEEQFQHDFPISSAGLDKPHDNMIELLDARQEQLGNLSPQALEVAQSMTQRQLGEWRGFAEGKDGARTFVTLSAADHVEKLLREASPLIDRLPVGDRRAFMDRLRADSALLKFYSAKGLLEGRVAAEKRRRGLG